MFGLAGYVPIPKMAHPLSANKEVDRVLEVLVRAMRTLTILA